jgi:hypothetical protein
LFCFVLTVPFKSKLRLQAALSDIIRLAFYTNNQSKELPGRCFGRAGLRHRFELICGSKLRSAILRPDRRLPHARCDRLMARRPCLPFGRRTYSPPVNRHRVGLPPHWSAGRQNKRPQLGGRAEAVFGLMPRGRPGTLLMWVRDPPLPLTFV